MLPLFIGTSSDSRAPDQHPAWTYWHMTSISLCVRWQPGCASSSTCSPLSRCSVSVLPINHQCSETTKSLSLRASAARWWEGLPVPSAQQTHDITFGSKPKSSHCFEKVHVRAQKACSEMNLTVVFVFLNISERNYFCSVFNQVRSWIFFPPFQTKKRKTNSPLR